MKIAVITVSDTVSRGERGDASGPAVVARCKELGWQVSSTHLVADDTFQIQTILKRLADEEKVDLILTTGGTGLGPRDGTPEATQSVADKNNSWLRRRDAPQRPGKNAARDTVPQLCRHPRYRTHLEFTWKSQRRHRIPGCGSGAAASFDSDHSRRPTRLICALRANLP